MTRDEIESVFWKATIMCLGLDPNDESDFVQKRVRKSWAKADIGTSDWKREENVVFLHIIPRDEETSRTANNVSFKYDRERDKHQEIVDFYDSYQITWVCYGPDAYEDAQTIRIGILRDAIRTFLQRNKIGIQPHITRPQYFPEQEDNGEWWERYDLTAYFYENVRRVYESESIARGPNIIIINQ